MTIEMLAVIAQLCNISAGGMNVTEGKIAKEQLTCQKYLIKCVKDTPLPPVKTGADAVADCLLKKDE